ELATLVLVVADPVGVRADPDAGRRRVDLLGAVAARVTTRIPRERNAVDRVQCGEPRTRNRTALRVVLAIRIVQPAVVTADVDGVRGDGHRVDGVGSGEVDPGRRHGRPAR